MPDINCRVAKLEANHEMLIKTIQKMDANLDVLTEQATKQKGFIAGVTLAISAVISIVTWWFNK